VAFHFERVISLSEVEYVNILAESTKPARLLRLAAVGAFGVLCLAWQYTLGLGILVLLGCLVVLIVPRMIPAGARSAYRRSEHLHKPLTCGVSEAGVWVRGESFDCNSRWNHPFVWRESEGWIVVSPNGLPSTFLRIADLRGAGCYEQVSALARTHGRHYGARQSSNASSPLSPER
jgi:hypothetical protein